MAHAITRREEDGNSRRIHATLMSATGSACVLSKSSISIIWHGPLVVLGEYPMDWERGVDRSKFPLTL